AFFDVADSGFTFSDEFINSTHGVDESLGAGKEGVTLVTHIDMECFGCSTNCKNVPASAGNRGFLVFRM
ncbi:MAG: hypothetical protein UV29_C0017G0012, partial [Candidatus Collierbacteria bacterium GW2011_GWD2_42_50]